MTRPRLLASRLRRTRKAVPAALLMTALTGCIHTVHVAPGDAGRRALDDLNTRSHRKATVTLTSGERLRGTGLIATSDSVRWTGSVVRQPVAISMIQEVRFVSHIDGALEGLAFGALAGAGVGAALATREGNAMAYFVGPIAMGTIGLAIGTITGAMKGDRRIYTFGVSPR